MDSIPDIPEFTSDQHQPLSKSQKRQQRKDDKAKRGQSVLEPRTPKQAELIKALKRFPVVIIIGPAGSGKTYVPTRFAVQRLLAGEIDRIVMSRSTVAPSRHRLGFRPGNDEQKMKGWLEPIVDAMREGAAPATLEKLRNEKRIDILPFETMRGRTIRDGVFLLDEAQNCTFEDLELFLTRIGENAQAVICGDPDQDKDLGNDMSGLMEIVKIAEDQGLDVGIIRFTEDDVVRSASAKQWVKAIKRYRQTKGIGLLN